MKLKHIHEAQYYQAKSFRNLLKFFDQVENIKHPELSGVCYEPKENLFVTIVERTKSTIFHEDVIRLTTDRTGVWVDYKQGNNGDWTSEDYLAEHTQVHQLGNPDENGLARRLF